MIYDYRPREYYIAALAVDAASVTQPVVIRDHSFPSLRRAAMSRLSWINTLNTR